MWGEAPLGFRRAIPPNETTARSGLIGGGGVRASAAGLPDPWREDADGWQPCPLEPGGLLGLPFEWEFAEAVLPGPPLARWLAATDGVTEATVTGRPLGEEGLRRQLDRLSVTDLGALPAVLLAELGRLVGAAWPEDDATVVALVS